MSEQAFRERYGGAFPEERAAERPDPQREGQLASRLATNLGIGLPTPRAPASPSWCSRSSQRPPATEVKRDQKQRGWFLGGIPPFGYRVDMAGALDPVPEQLAARRRSLRCG